VDTPLPPLPNHAIKKLLPFQQISDGRAKGFWYLWQYDDAYVASLQQGFLI
jgi:hypothetical protein